MHILCFRLACTLLLPSERAPGSHCTDKAERLQPLPSRVGAHLAEKEQGILERLQLLAAIVQRELPQRQGGHAGARSLFAQMQQLKDASVPILDLAFQHVPAPSKHCMTPTGSSEIWQVTPCACKACFL